MADINRSSGYDLILKEPELHHHHVKIQVSEKLNMIKQLAVRLEHIEHVEVEQVKLQMATLQKEVEGLKVDLAQKVDIK